MSLEEFRGCRTSQVQGGAWGCEALGAGDPGPLHRQLRCADPGAHHALRHLRILRGGLRLPALAQQPLRRQLFCREFKRQGGLEIYMCKKLSASLRREYQRTHLLDAAGVFAASVLYVSRLPSARRAAGGLCGPLGCKRRLRLISDRSSFFLVW